MSRRYEDYDPYSARYLSEQNAELRLAANILSRQNDELRDRLVQLTLCVGVLTAWGVFGLVYIITDLIL